MTRLLCILAIGPAIAGVLALAAVIGVTVWTLVLGLGLAWLVTMIVHEGFEFARQGREAGAPGALAANQRPDCQTVKVGRANGEPSVDQSLIKSNKSSRLHEKQDGGDVVPVQFPVVTER